MKMKYQLPIAIASIAIATSNISAAQSPDGRIHNVTVSLQAAFEGDYTSNRKEDKPNYEESVKIVNEKISNKQVLEALVEDGFIEEIKGYSIVMLTDSNANILGVFLRKNKEVVENITDYFDAGLADVDGLDGFKASYKDNKDQDLYQSTNDFRTLGYVGFDIVDLSFETQGLVELKTALTDDGANDEYTTFVKTGNFSDLTGYGSYEDVIITGGIKASEGAKYTFPN